MRHPKRAITREIRARHPKRAGRERAEFENLTWPDRLRVGEVMSRPALTIPWEAEVAAAWKLMRVRRIRHLPVLDDQGRLVGIVTDRDLRQVVFDPELQPERRDASGRLGTLAVRALMTWGVITVGPDADVRQAARIMREHRVGALPVLDRGRVVGIVTERDLIRAFVDALDQGVLSRPTRQGLER